MVDLPISLTLTFSLRGERGPARAFSKLLLFSSLFLLAVMASAHPANMAAAQAKIAVDGSFELMVRFDVLAYCLDLPPTVVADGPMNALLDGPPAALESKLSDAKRRFLDHLQMLGDGVAAKIDSY